MVEFSKWFRRDMSDVDFIWNLLMLTITDGVWIIVMLIYHSIKNVKRRNSK